MAGVAPASRSRTQASFQTKDMEVAKDGFTIDATILRTEFDKFKDELGDGELGQGTYPQALLTRYKLANGGNKSNRGVRRDVLAFLEDGTPFRPPASM